MSAPCDLVLGELTPTGPTPAGEAHARTCPSCKELLASFLALGKAPPVKGDRGTLEGIRQKAAQELRRTPVARSWMLDAMLLAVVLSCLGVICSLLFTWRDSLAGEAAERKALMLMGCQLVLALTALAPWKRARLVAPFALILWGAAGLETVLGLGPTEGEAGPRCAPALWLMGALPLAAGAWFLRNTAPSFLRAGLVGLASGSVGALALYLHCPDTALSHVGPFHLAAWIAMGLVALPLARVLRPRSFAP